MKNILFEILSKLANNFHRIKNKRGIWAIHTETIFDDEIWKKVKKFVADSPKEKCKWFVMTPVNYEYIKSAFGFGGSKKRMEKIMRKRYTYLKNHGQIIELHIHLSILRNLSYSDQERMFEDALIWLKKIGIEPKEFIAGWFHHDENTVKICKKMDLKLIMLRDYFHIHDYEL